MDSSVVQYCFENGILSCLDSTKIISGVIGAIIGLLIGIPVDRYKTKKKIKDENENKKKNDCQQYLDELKAYFSHFMGSLDEILIILNQPNNQSAIDQKLIDFSQFKKRLFERPSFVTEEKFQELKNLFVKMDNFVESVKLANAVKTSMDDFSHWNIPIGSPQFTALYSWNERNIQNFNRCCGNAEVKKNELSTTPKNIFSV